jgi:subtilase family serine protease
MSIGKNKRRTRVATLAALPAAAALVVAGFAVSAPAQAAAPAMQAIPNSQPTWATAQADRGAVSGEQLVTVYFWLNSKNPSGLSWYTNHVSMPGYPLYHHYLTPKQQADDFGPSAAGIKTAKAWLIKNKVKITGETEQYIVGIGPASAVGHAFGTSLHNYAVDGSTYYAPDSTASLPTSLAPYVLGVTGLTNAPTNMQRPMATPSPTSKPRTNTSSATCGAYYNQNVDTSLPPAYGAQQPMPLCGYMPKQLRKAYGVTASGLTGKGVTVAIVDAFASPTLVSDTTKFFADSGIEAWKSGQLKQVVTPKQWTNVAACGGVAGWTPEESLDVESVHTMAPDANVLYMGENSCSDDAALAVYANIVDYHRADIVSNSWGEDIFDSTGDESIVYRKAYHQMYEQAATEGIGFYYSSGDCSTLDPAIVNNGANCIKSSTTAQAPFPAQDPDATAVGATTLIVDKNSNYVTELGMGDTVTSTNSKGQWDNPPGTFYFGAGGGTSAVYAQPWYQRNVVPNALALTLPNGTRLKTPNRVTPDVAMEGDLYESTMVGVTMDQGSGNQYYEAGFGGTSVACPQFAGIQADAQQALGHAIGFANPLIYGEYRWSHGHRFHDAVDNALGRTWATAYQSQSGADVLATLGRDYTLKATPGYDEVTGLGSPAPGYLAAFKER